MMQNLRSQLLSNQIRYIASLLLFLLTIIPGQATVRKVQVQVGGYEFPPFVIVKDGKTTGLTFDFIRELNRFQNKYIFKFILTTPNRRYSDFNKKYFDLLFFESKHWGWDSYETESSNIFLKGGEVYIARHQPGRDQSYFKVLHNKKLLGILGYHYRFANFESDPTKLKKRFDIGLTSTHSGNILSIIFGRADIAIVTESYLKMFLFRHPHYRHKLIISEHYDQEYHHSILIRKGFIPGR